MAYDSLYGFRQRAHQYLGRAHDATLLQLPLNVKVFSNPQPVGWSEPVPWGRLGPYYFLMVRWYGKNNTQL